MVRSSLRERVYEPVRVRFVRCPPSATAIFSGNDALGSRAGAKETFRSAVDFVTREDRGVGKTSASIEIAIPTPSNESAAHLQTRPGIGIPRLHRYDVTVCSNLAQPDQQPK